MPDLPITEAGHDIVTPKAAAILREAGEDAYTRLVVSGPSPSAAQGALQGVTYDQIIAQPIKHTDDAMAALAGLWLWYDALDESHRISQDIVTPTGSFWHAIMHRREGDFSNSKYWYHRCPSHHVIRMMGAVASSVARETASDRLVARALSGGWNPDGFVDLVQAVHNKPEDPRHAIAARLQRVEWEGLFDYCIHAAVEADHTSLDDWDRRVINP
ncbi:MAG TPA: hypothetical protein VN541_18255 [Tepidisphaeraceae bacterium]|nr:hypothetical protein [Tepidisphaeraceae bacterium]